MSEKLSEQLHIALTPTMLEAIKSYAAARDFISNAHAARVLIARGLEAVDARRE